MHVNHDTVGMRGRDLSGDGVVAGVGNIEGRPVMPAISFRALAAFDSHRNPGSFGACRFVSSGRDRFTVGLCITCLGSSMDIGFQGVVSTNY